MPLRVYSTHCLPLESRAQSGIHIDSQFDVATCLVHCTALHCVVLAGFVHFKERDDALIAMSKLNSTPLVDPTLLSYSITH